MGSWVLGVAVSMWGRSHSVGVGASRRCNVVCCSVRRCSRWRCAPGVTRAKRRRFGVRRLGVLIDKRQPMRGMVISLRLRPGRRHDLTWLSGWLIRRSSPVWGPSRTATWWGANNGLGCGLVFVVKVAPVTSGGVPTGWVSSRREPAHANGRAASDGEAHNRAACSRISRTVIPGGVVMSPKGWRVRVTPLPGGVAIVSGCPWALGISRKALCLPLRSVKNAAEGTDVDN